MLQSRRADGKADLSAPAPRTPDGKPDTSLKLRGGLTPPTGKGGEPGKKQELTFVQNNSAAIEEQIERGALDLVFVAVPPGRPGLEWVRVFDQVMSEAVTRGVPCAGVVLLNEDQEDFAAQLKPRKAVAVLRRPVTLKQLHRKLTELMTVARPEEAR